MYSARYAGENCSYSDNVNKLLLDMENIDQKFRTATFKTVLPNHGLCAFFVSKTETEITFFFLIIKRNQNERKLLLYHLSKLHHCFVVVSCKK